MNAGASPRATMQAPRTRPFKRFADLRALTTLWRRHHADPAIPHLYGYLE